MIEPGYAVLLVEDDSDFARLTTFQLTACGHQVTAVSTMHEALDQMERGGDDLDVVVLDLGLPDIEGLDGVGASVHASGLPVIVYTGDDRTAVRSASAELGASAYLVKTRTDADTLDAVIREVVVDTVPRPVPRSAGHSDPYDGPEEAIRSTCELLGIATGFDRWAFVRPVAGTEIVLVRSGPGDELSPGRTVVWAERLRTDNGTLVDGTIGPGALTEPEPDLVTVARAIVTPIPTMGGVLVGWGITSDRNPSALARPLTAYAARQIATLHDLEARWVHASRRADIAGAAASVDVLTGLGNRRAFNRHLRIEEARCYRHDQPALVVVVDLDELKVINDRDGHPAGDRCLRTAAGAIVEAMRAADGVFRIGGDEFAAVAVACDEQQGPEIERRLASILEEAGIAASIGWAARPPHPSLLAAYIAADTAMYADKDRRRGDLPDGAAAGGPTGPT